jgi:hypothetical protein
MDKMKKASRSLVDTGAKTMLKVRFIIIIINNNNNNNNNINSNRTDERRSVGS